MNSREIVLKGIERGKRRVDGSSDFSESDLAALRELDQLLEEAYKQFHNQMHNAGGFNILEVMKLSDRLAQAGYGEK